MIKRLTTLALAMLMSVSLYAQEAAETTDAVVEDATEAAAPAKKSEI